MVQNGCMQPLADLLMSVDVGVVSIAMESLDNIFKKGKEESKQTGNANPYILLFEQHNGVDHLEALQEHRNENIYKKAVSLIETYFGMEEEEDLIVTPIAMGDTFAFGTGHMNKRLDAISFPQQ